MSVDHLNFKWWTDDQGWLWVRHRCLNGKVDVWHPPTPWRLDGDGGVTPSFACQKCGCHVILRAADRIDADAHSGDQAEQ